MAEKQGGRGKFRACFCMTDGRMILTLSVGLEHCDLSLPLLFPFFFSITMKTPLWTVLCLLLLHPFDASQSPMESSDGYLPIVDARGKGVATYHPYSEQRYSSLPSESEVNNLSLQDLVATRPKPVREEYNAMFALHPKIQAIDLDDPGAVKALLDLFNEVGQSRNLKGKLNSSIKVYLSQARPDDKELFRSYISTRHQMGRRASMQSYREANAEVYKDRLRVATAKSKAKRVLDQANGVIDQPLSMYMPMGGKRLSPVEVEKLSWDFDLLYSSRRKSSKALENYLKQMNYSPQEQRLGRALRSKRIDELWRDEKKKERDKLKERSQASLSSSDADTSTQTSWEVRQGQEASNTAFGTQEQLEQNPSTSHISPTSFSNQIIPNVAPDFPYKWKPVEHVHRNLSPPLSSTTSGYTSTATTPPPLALNGSSDELDDTWKSYMID